MDPREAVGAVVWRRGAGLSGDRETGGGEMRLGSAGVRRREAARTVFGIWLVFLSLSPDPLPSSSSLLSSSEGPRGGLGSTGGF